MDELRALIARHARADETTAIPGVHVSAVTEAGVPHAATTGTVLAVVAQGAKRLGLGERVYDYAAGQYLVASVDLPVTGHWTRASEEEPALGFGLELRPRVIASLLLEAPPGPAAAPEALGVADAEPELLDAVTRMLRLLDRPADQAVLAPMIEREILWRVLNGPLGPTVRQIGIADSSLSAITRAVRWITEHVAEPFRVADLARDCAMSTSAFHRAFHAVTAQSPIQFQIAAAPAARPPAAALRRRRRRHGGLPGRLRQRLPVQPRVPPPVRPAARPRRRAAQSSARTPAVTAAAITITTIIGRRASSARPAAARPATRASTTIPSGESAKVS